MKRLLLLLERVVLAYEERTLLLAKMAHAKSEKDLALAAQTRAYTPPVPFYAPRPTTAP